MTAHLLYVRNTNALNISIAITGSKSESNRLLILQALYPNINLQNVSNSDDSSVLKKALATESKFIDIHHAGTAMRFLTAYFASKKGTEVILTGSSRMKERPIGILVAALRELGATIEYVENEGFPPLKIVGTSLSKNKVTIQANVSSQYISAMLLIAPSLPNGLEINLEGKPTSIPYIEMTLSLLKKIGIEGSYSKNSIKIHPKLAVENCVIAIESDWSSASYFYSLVALSDNLQVTLKTYFQESLQGDSGLISIYEKLGVGTIFNSEENSITLYKTNSVLPQKLTLDLADTPDIAQTIAVSCFGLQISCTLTGLHTLLIKETNRLQALKTELEQLGATVSITESSLTLQAKDSINKNVEIATYQDHRMAMAFAPLALKVPISINNAEVVSKSYPTFWSDLKKMGIHSL